ncbi:MAG: hypothetical protein Kow00108_00800 [Calditrichia bacterium]
MKKNIIILLMLCTSLLWAQSDNMEFLNFSYNPRSASAGGLHPLFYSDAAQLMQFPAAIYFSEKPAAGMNYTNHLLDIYGASAFYVRPVQLKFMSNRGVAGIYILDMNYGEVKEIDDGAFYTGRTVSANDFALGFSFSSLIEKNLVYGATIKIAHSTIAGYSSSALLVDFSLLYQLERFYKLHIYGTFRNIGLFLSSYTDASQSLPFAYDIGFSKELKYLPLTFGFAVSNILSQSNGYIESLDKWKIGGELRLHPKLQVRAGYNRQINVSLKTENGDKFTGTSFGLGLNLRNMNFDFGWIFWGDAGTLNQFGFNYHF